MAQIEQNARRLALELGVIGLMNVQFAVKDGEVYVLEVNPRASRTVPFVAKATGVPLAKIAAKVMAGKTLDELDVHDRALPMHVAVKESVFPFSKFAGVDTILGPEMRSTGEVMGIALNFAAAFEKSLAAAGVLLPDSGRAFISVKEEDRAQACHLRGDSGTSASASWRREGPEGRSPTPGSCRRSQAQGAENSPRGAAKNGAPAGDPGRGRPDGCELRHGLFCRTSPRCRRRWPGARIHAREIRVEIQVAGAAWASRASASATASGRTSRQRWTEVQPRRIDPRGRRAQGITRR